MSYLRIEHLSYRYPDVGKQSTRWALRDISFQAEKGEFVTVVGPSGSGKSTLLKNIAGILLPTKGKIVLDGKDITNQPPERRNVGYVPQNQALFPHLTVWENIEFGLKARKWSKERRTQRVEELATLGGLEELLERRPSQLSGGQRQRVALLRALASYPRLLLLDEPLSNLDAQLRENLALYLKELQRTFGITTIMVTHDLEEAKILADTIVVMNEGELLQAGSPIEVLRCPRSLKVAKILDLKNVYEIMDVQVLGDMVILKLPFGYLKFQELDSMQREKLLVNRPMAVHLDPLFMILQDVRNVTKGHSLPSEDNLFMGKVIAIIIGQDIQEVTVLVKLTSSESFTTSKHVHSENEVKTPEKKRIDGNDVLRIKVTLKEGRMPSVDDDVLIKIPAEAISLYFK